MTRESDCDRTRGLLDAFVDRELGLEQSLAVEAHLRACPPCLAIACDIERLQRSIRDTASYVPAPAGLAERVAPRRARRRRRLRWTAAAGAAAAVLLLAVAAGPRGWDLGPHGEQVVYHVNSADHLRAVLRNIGNHLDASPHARIVVVAHNDGIGLLLQDTRDADGRAYEPQIAALKSRGVAFRACGTTLALRQIDAARVLPEAVTVPSGIAEIARLQAREGYAYLRL